MSQSILDCLKMFYFIRVSAIEKGVASSLEVAVVQGVFELGMRISQ